MFPLTACKQSHIKENFALRVSQTQNQAAHEKMEVFPLSLFIDPCLLQWLNQVLIIW